MSIFVLGPPYPTNAMGTGTVVHERVGEMEMATESKWERGRGRREGGREGGREGRREAGRAGTLSEKTLL